MVKLNMKALAGTAVGGAMAAAMFVATPALAQETCTGAGCGGPIDGTPGDPTVPTPVDPGTPTNPGTINNGGNGGAGGNGGNGGAGGNGGEGGAGGNGYGGEGGAGGSVTDSGNSTVTNSGNNVGGNGGSSTGNVTTNNIQTGGFSYTNRQVRQAPAAFAQSGPAMAGITCANSNRGFGLSTPFGGASVSGATRTDNECVATVVEASRDAAICQSGLQSPDDAIRASAAEQCLPAGVGSVRARVLSGEANTGNGSMGLLFGAQAAPVQPVYVQVPAENVTYEDAGRVAPRRVERVMPPAPNMDGNQ